MIVNRIMSSVLIFVLLLSSQISLARDYTSFDKLNDLNLKALILINSYEKESLERVVTSSGLHIDIYSLLDEYGEYLGGAIIGTSLYLTIWASLVFGGTEGSRAYGIKHPIALGMLGPVILMWTVIFAPNLFEDTYLGRYLQKDEMRKKQIRYENKIIRTCAAIAKRLSIIFSINDQSIVLNVQKSLEKSFIHQFYYYLREGSLNPDRKVDILEVLADSGVEDDKIREIETLRETLRSLEIKSDAAIFKRELEASREQVEREAIKRAQSLITVLEGESFSEEPKIQDLLLELKDILIIVDQERSQLLEGGQK